MLCTTGHKQRWSKQQLQKLGRHGILPTTGTSHPLVPEPALVHPGLHGAISRSYLGPLLTADPGVLAGMAVKAHNQRGSCDKPKKQRKAGFASNLGFSALHSQHTQIESPSSPAPRSALHLETQAHFTEKQSCPKPLALIRRWEDSAASIFLYSL